jgi:ATP-dependent Clp protease ATP-binding subunit ClpC
LFLGPTGVGKTEVAKALAEFMFGQEDRLVALDMSEYQEQHSIARLVGAPPGYVGHDESGQLTEAVRRNPYSVILFDEVEKAHPDVFNVLLQILEEGRLTDAKGRAVDFKNCIVVLTSNLGSEKSQRQAMGFTNPSGASLRMDTEMREAAKKFFKPELLNRIDEIVVFSPLAHEEILGITGKFVDQVAKRLSEHKVSMTLSPAACDLLSVIGFDEKYGARPLRRAVQRLVEDPLSEQLLSGLLRAGDSVVVDAIGDEVVVRIETPDRDGTVSV